MILVKEDPENKFVSMFNSETGHYIRSGVLENGVDTDIDPFMTKYPELLDIGIMGNCAHGRSGLCLQSGTQCYQSGLYRYEPNMTLENFKKIIDECKGKTFQVALGGRGDPDQHENFGDILKYCKDNNIVPNFTSSGLGFSEATVKLCKEYCGAVAISWYRRFYTTNALEMLIKGGVKTNIHYVLGDTSIDEAIAKLKSGVFHPGINAVIFLLHKPVGLGTEDNVLKADDPRVKEFFGLVDAGKFDFKIGFDSCSVPGILNFAPNVNRDSIDTCEGGRYSAYIAADMKMMPCSFDNQDMKYAYDISVDTVSNAWNSTQFNAFRASLKDSCPTCTNQATCKGGCPLQRSIILCNKEERTL